MEPPSPMNDSRDIWSGARRAQGKQGTRTRGWYASSPATWPSPVHLPGSLGLCLCLHHVYRSGRDPGARLHTVRQVATVLQERDELAFGLRIAFDVALGHGETGMAREFLHIPETPPHL